MTEQRELPEGVTWEEQMIRKARGLPRTEIVITHKDLNVVCVIRDASHYMAATKATAQVQSWDQEWDHKWRNLSYATSKELAAMQQAQKAQASLSVLQGILHDGLYANHNVGWKELESPFTEAKPSEPVRQSEPKRPVKPRDPEDEPIETDYKYQSGWMAIFFPSLRKEARQHFQYDHNRWREALEDAKRYPAQLEEWQKGSKQIREENKRAQAAWENAISEWQNRKEQHESTERDRIRSFKEAVNSRERVAVEDFFSIVLERSDYPDYFPHEFTLAYNPETKIIVCDYQLPSPGALPTLKEVKYVKSRKALTEKHLNKKDSQALYDSVAYQICLRTTYELFSADQFEALDLVTFNGWVREVDRGTGRDINPCILSLQATRQALEEIDLTRVEPKACFKSLKGVGSTKLHALAPVAPLLQLDTEDDRFIEGRSIANGLAEGTNLAAARLRTSNTGTL